VKVVKNKMAPPFKEVEFDIVFGKGISRVGEIVDIGVEQNIIEKTGPWYAYNEMRIGQGRENAKEFMTTHPDIAQEIMGKIRENFNAKKGE